jgi:tRNAThr (cytosine32-N3)-methyltransferase
MNFTAKIRIGRNPSIEFLRFFKDRNWLKLEFPELFNQQLTKETHILEIGCGAGNTFFPIVRQKIPNLFVYGCDYSSTAVEIVKNHPEYDEHHGKAFVYDISSPDLPSFIPPASIDIISCVFVLSALHPNTWENAVKNIWTLLKPGGLVVLRDYGRYDLTQLRMKRNRRIGENFYIRGDGTRVYFFTNEELSTIFSKFEILQNAADRRLLVNRAKKLKMFRIWVQGKFKKL